MGVRLTPDDATTALGAVVREQLQAAYQRGWDDHAADTNGLVDVGAPAAFKAIMTAALDLSTAVSLVWREREPRRPAGGTL